MKPLMLLVTVFVIAAAILKIVTGSWNCVLSGNLAMFFMLCFTAMGHFMFTKGMTMMMPRFIPFKKQLVFFTGIAEVLLGAALLFPQLRYGAGLVLILLFVLMLPANIHAAMNHLDYEKASYDGKGPSYLWFRIPLQLLFIGWLLYFAIRT
jgi:uncharacterized membrane protein